MAQVYKSKDYDVAIILTDAQYRVLRSFLWATNNLLHTDYNVLDEVEENFKYFGLLRQDLDLSADDAKEMAESLIDSLV